MITLHFAMLILSALYNIHQKCEKMINYNSVKDEVIV
jgi:hypothetical protein